MCSSLVAEFICWRVCCCELLVLIVHGCLQRWWMQAKQTLYHQSTSHCVNFTPTLFSYKSALPCAKCVSNIFVQRSQPFFCFGRSRTYILRCDWHIEDKIVSWPQCLLFLKLFFYWFYVGRCFHLYIVACLIE